MERIRQRVLSLHRGQTKPEGDLSREQSENRVGGEKGAEVPPYLAGVMDSDGTFKIEKRKVKRMINPHFRIKDRSRTSRTLASDQPPC